MRIGTAERMRVAATAAMGMMILALPGIVQDGSVSLFFNRIVATPEDHPGAEAVRVTDAESLPRGSTRERLKKPWSPRPV